VHDGNLSNDESGKRVEIDLVDTPIDDQIAHNAEQNQDVTPA